MTRYARKTTNGITLFCDSLSPMQIKRTDETIELYTSIALPMFEQLAMLEDIDEKDGASQIAHERDRYLNLIADLARQNLLRYKHDHSLVMRLFKQDYANLAERFAMKRQTGLSDERYWDKLIEAYIDSKDFKAVRKKA